MKRLPGLADTEEVEALNSLVAGLEKLASSELRPESEQEFECASLRAVLDHLRIVIDPWFQESGISVAWRIADDVPMVRADHHGVLQVFLNLVRNARRVLENCERRAISISASVEEGRVMVRFHNSGPPIADAVQLFEPFHSEATGRGIGLYVSRAILRSFGGDLRLEPVPDGVCFTVVLEKGGLWYMYKDR
jgi:C4-dicarboxylate-specific signal transduction histidine kinase